MYSPRAGFNMSPQTLACRRIRLHSAYCLGEMLVQLDSTTPVIDGAEYRGGLDALVADKQQTIREVRRALEETQTAKDRRKRSQNDRIGRASPGGQAKVGDNLLAKEAASTTVDGMGSLEASTRALGGTMAGS